MMMEWSNEIEGKGTSGRGDKGVKRKRKGRKVVKIEVIK
jgi:hypothetical protein